MRARYRDPDKTTRVFIGIVTSDPEMDFRLGCLLGLFATDFPWWDNGYSHHDGYRTLVG